MYNVSSDKDKPDMQCIADPTVGEANTICDPNKKGYSQDDFTRECEMDCIADTTLDWGPDNTINKVGQHWLPFDLGVCFNDANMEKPEKPGD